MNDQALPSASQRLTSLRLKQRDQAGDFAFHLMEPFYRRRFALPVGCVADQARGDRGGNGTHRRDPDKHENGANDAALRRTIQEARKQ